MTKTNPMNRVASTPKRLIALLQLTMVFAVALLCVTASQAQVIPTMNLVIREVPSSVTIGAPVKGKVYLHRSDQPGDLTSHTPGGEAVQIKVDLLKQGETIVLATQDVAAGAGFNLPTVGRTAGMYTIRATDKAKSPVTEATLDVELAEMPTLTLSEVEFGGGGAVSRDDAPQTPYETPH